MFKSLTPPTRGIFLVSTVVALVAVLAWLGILRLPIVQANLFETLLLAFVLLWLGTVVRGL